MACGEISRFAPDHVDFAVALHHFNQLDRFLLHADHQLVDPALPKDVKTITLSYTFFEVGGMDKTAGR